MLALATQDEPEATSAMAEPSGEGNASEGSESSGEGSSAEEGEVTLDELFKSLEKVVTDFRGVGLLAGFISLIGLLMLVLRFKPLNAWLEKKGWKKYKPWVAAGLGGILACLTALAAGTEWWKAVIAGVFAAVTALASVGLHNLLTAGNADKKKPGMV